MNEGVFFNHDDFSLFCFIQSELKRPSETNNVPFTVNDLVICEKLIEENTYLKNEVLYLKTALESKEKSEKENQEIIHRLQLRITALEDWNDDDDDDDGQSLFFYHSNKTIHRFLPFNLDNNAVKKPEINHVVRESSLSKQKIHYHFSKKDHSDLQANIDTLASRNRQLESDLQRLQLQQKNDQLALERLDEYEETIGQLQEQLNQLRSNKKKQQSM